MSSDKFNVLKTSSIEDRDHLTSETIGISCIFCCFHPLQTGKMIVFDNLICHPHYRRIRIKAQRQFLKNDYSEPTYLIK